MDVDDFTLPCSRPEHFDAAAWLDWANHMRNWLDKKRNVETHKIRAWHNLTRGDAARAAALVVSGAPNMGRFLVLLDYLECRAAYVEARVFRALGLHDDELVPPPLPAALYGMTADDAAKIMGGADAWALLFDGRRRKPQEPEPPKAPAAETVKKPRRRRKTEGAP